MHLLILGGSLDHPGGVEAFCERSMEALSHRVDWRMHRIATRTAYLTLAKLPRLFSGWAAVLKYRFRERPDLVWLQYVNLPDLSYLVLAKLLGLRVMVTPHLGSNWRSQSNPFLRAISGWLLGRADRLALISKTQESEINLPAHVPRSLIRNFLPAHILGADLPDTTKRPPRLQLIHSGRLSEGKGTFLFVEVCAQLKASGVPFNARITGGADDTTFSRLHKLIARLDVSDQVKVLGRVPESDLLELLRGSDVLVHLSRIDSYPLIVLEAIACAMLPVCLELAGARDMVQTYGGAIVSASDPVHAAIGWLLSLDVVDLRRCSRIAASEVRKDYGWDNCAGALQAAVEACLPLPEKASSPSVTHRV